MPSKSKQYHIPGGEMALVVLFTIVFSPFLLAWATVKIVRWRRFVKRNAGRAFFIWTSRRGWRELVINNVLPALPPEISALHDTFHKDEILWNMYDIVSRYGRNCRRARPYLVIFERRRPRVISLNEQLRPYKSQSRRDVGVQESIRSLLLKAISANGTKPHVR